MYTASATVPAIATTDERTVRLAAGIGFSDLSVDASDCGQFLMITCRDAILAVVGASGSDVAAIEFADGRRYPPEQLIELVAA